MSGAFALQNDSLKIWESWERVAELPFSPRDGVGVVRFNNELWMLGGWAYGPLTNEIYKSSDGLQWEKVGEGAWQGRHCAVAPGEGGHEHPVQHDERAEDHHRQPPRADDVEVSVARAQRLDTSTGEDQ
ncbi:MAG: hypothetical protein KY428_09075, partial [Bacteroidetes bacterium]|nr:hypothetical protein [Bacteroidota bacterium]